MGIGVRGHISFDNLHDFAIGIVFSFPKDPQGNRQAASCKVCSERLPKTEGTEVYVTDQRYFLCTRCADGVRRAKARLDARRTDGRWPEGGWRACAEHLAILWREDPGVTRCPLCPA